MIDLVTNLVVNILVQNEDFSRSLQCYVLLFPPRKEIVVYYFCGLKIATKEDNANLLVLVNCACQNLKVTMVALNAVGFEKG